MGTQIPNPIGPPSIPMQEHSLINQAEPPTTSNFQNRGLCGLRWGLKNTTISLTSLDVWRFLKHFGGIRGCSHFTNYVDKILAFLTTYLPQLRWHFLPYEHWQKVDIFGPPPLVNVVCEQPLIRKSGLFFFVKLQWASSRFSHLIFFSIFQRTFVELWY